MPDGRPAKIIHCILSGKVTWKDLGVKILNDLEYKLKGRRNLVEIWDLVVKCAELQGMVGKQGYCPGEQGYDHSSCDVARFVKLINYLRGRRGKPNHWAEHSFAPMATKLRRCCLTLILAPHGLGPKVDRSEATPPLERTM
jgi:hypothetical protein